MLDPDDLDLPTLLKLHKRLGALICEEMGHAWRDVRFSNTSVSTSDVEKCTRCGETRQAGVTSSNSATDLTVSVGPDDLADGEGV